MAPKRESPAPFVENVDTQYLETLIGYNARRAALSVIERFLRDMAVHDFRVVDFSVASLIYHNPGITSRQLCTALSILPPNLVALVNGLEKRGVITKRPHPNDGRAIGLYVTPQGEALMAQAELDASNLEIAAGSRLTVAERKTLLRLLQKVYL
jgi:DNA-binding MarR family transcriptional regulator